MDPFEGPYAQDKPQADAASSSASSDPSQNILSMLSEIIWRYDFSHKRELISSYLSPASDSMLGLPAGTIAQNPEEFFSYVHPDDLSAVRDFFFQGCLEPGGDKCLEYRLKRADGSIIWVRSTGSAHLQPGGRMVVAGITSDITHQKQAQIRDSLAKEVLDLLNRGEISHNNLRQILQKIRQDLDLEVAGIRLRQVDGFSCSHAAFGVNLMVGYPVSGVGDQPGQVTLDGDGWPVLQSLSEMVLEGKIHEGHPLLTPGGSFWTSSHAEIQEWTKKLNLQDCTGNPGLPRDYGSIALIPLRYEGSILGLLQLIDHRSGRFDPETITFLEELGNQMGTVLARKEVEEASKRVEDRFQNTASLITDFVYSCRKGPDGPFALEWIAGALEEITGYTLEEIRVMTCWKPLVIEEDQPLFERFVAGLEPGKAGRCEVRIRRKDGRIVDLASFTKCERDPENPECFILYGACRDISRSKQAERSLSVSIERYRTLVENAEEAIFVAQDGRLKFINQIAEKMTGYSLQELTSRPFTEFIHPEDRELVMSRHLSRFKGDTVQSRYSFRVVGKDGNIRWVEIGAVLIEWEGRPATLNLLTDITERKMTEEALKSSEEKFYSAFRSSPVIIAITSLEDSRFIEVNETFERISGYRRDEVIGRTTHQLRIWEYPEQAKAIIERLLRGSPVRNEECTYRAKNGELIIGLFSAEKVDLGGKPCAISVIMDITERKQAEKALQKSEEKYRDLVENLNDIVFTIDTQGIITYVSSAARQMGGYEPQELIGHPYAEMIYQEDLPDLYRKFKETLGNRIVSWEFRYRTKDGQIRWARTSSRPILEDGRVVGIHGIFSDVTEQKRSEEKLRQLNTFLDSIIENIPNMIFIKEAKQLRFVRFNRAGEELVGRSRDELLGKNDHGKNDHDIFPQSQTDFFTEMDREALEQKRIIDIPEETIQTRFRGKRILHTWKVPILNAQGEPEFLLGISEDITERKLGEAALIQAKEAAEDATRAKSEFLANMSHEIRTPLNGIIGMMELLMDSKLDEEQLDYAKIALNSGKILISLINDILDFSKIEARKLELKQLDFELDTVLMETVDLLAMSAKEKGLKLDCWMDPGTPARLRGDPERLRQILINLGSNAIKFTSEGGISIWASPEMVEDGWATLRFSVRDTGIGIAENRQNILFSPFTQIDSTTTRKYGGTGLGLAISKQLVELMGGSIGVESREGVGSTFWFTVPFEISGLYTTIPGLMAPPEPKLSGEGTGQGLGGAERLTPVPVSEYPGGKARILLVEDNPLNQKVMQIMLGKLGCQVDVVIHGKEALNALRSIPYDLVLMDCQMPEMDGFEATTLIRHPDSMVLNPDIPIIAVTASILQSDSQRCFSAGMNDFIAKPIQRKELAELLAKWLPKFRWK